jgi:hypothetical protein
LRLQLVSSKQFALLSAETLINAPSNAFSYLHQEYSAAYIIEGRVIEVGEQLQVTLNLVHAKTAIVEHTFTAAVGSTEGGNKELVVKYIKLLGAILAPTAVILFIET